MSLMIVHMYVSSPEIILVLSGYVDVEPDIDLAQISSVVLVST